MEQVEQARQEQRKRISNQAKRMKIGRAHV